MGSYSSEQNHAMSGAQRRTAEDMGMRIWKNFRPITAGNVGGKVGGYPKSPHKIITREHRQVRDGGGITYHACNAATTNTLVGRLTQAMLPSPDVIANMTQQQQVNLAYVAARAAGFVRRLASQHVQVTHGGDTTETGQAHGNAGRMLRVTYGPQGHGTTDLASSAHKNCLAELDRVSRVALDNPSGQNLNTWSSTPMNLESRSRELWKRHGVEEPRLTVAGFTPALATWQDFRTFLAEHGGAKVYLLVARDAKLVYVQGVAIEAAFITQGHTGFHGIGHCQAVRADGYVPRVTGIVTTNANIADTSTMVWAAGAGMSRVCTGVRVTYPTIGVRTYNGAGTVAALIRKGARQLRQANGNDATPCIVVTPDDHLWNSDTVVKVEFYGTALKLHYAALLATAVVGMALVPVGHTKTARRRIRRMLGTPLKGAAAGTPELGADTTTSDESSMAMETEDSGVSSVGGVDNTQVSGGTPSHMKPARQPVNRQPRPVTGLRKPGDLRVDFMTSLVMDTARRMGGAAGHCLRLYAERARKDDGITNQHVSGEYAIIVGKETVVSTMWPRDGDDYMKAFDVPVSRRVVGVPAQVWT